MTDIKSYLKMKIDRMDLRSYFYTPKKITYNLDLQSLDNKKILNEKFTECFSERGKEFRNHQLTKEIDDGTRKNNILITRSINFDHAPLEMKIKQVEFERERYKNKNRHLKGTKDKYLDIDIYVLSKWVIKTIYKKMEKENTNHQYLVLKDDGRVDNLIWNTLEDYHILLKEMNDGIKNANRQNNILNTGSINFDHAPLEMKTRRVEFARGKGKKRIIFELQYDAQVAKWVIKAIYKKIEEKENSNDEILVLKTDENTMYDLPRGRLTNRRVYGVIRDMLNDLEYLLPSQQQEENTIISEIETENNQEECLIIEQTKTQMLKTFEEARNFWEEEETQENNEERSSPPIEQTKTQALQEAETRKVAKLNEATNIEEIKSKIEVLQGLWNEE